MLAGIVDQLAERMHRQRGMGDDDVAAAAQHGDRREAFSGSNGIFFMIDGRTLLPSTYISSV